VMREQWCPPVSPKPKPGGQAIQQTSGVYGALTG